MYKMRKIIYIIAIIFIFTVCGCQFLPGKEKEIDHSQKGYDLYEQHKYKEAIGEFKKAISLKPSDVKAHYFLGCAYTQEGNYKAAKEEFEFVIKLAPESEQAKIVKTEWLPTIQVEVEVEKEKIGEKKEPEKKLPTYEVTEAKKIHVFRQIPLPSFEKERKSDAYHYYVEGVKSSRNGKWDLAIAQFEKALQIDPDYSLVYTELGIAYAKKAFFDKSISLFQTAIQKDAENVVAHYNLGAIYEGKGTWSQAIQEYMKVVSLDPNNVEVRRRLGICFMEVGQNAAAMDQFNIAVTLDPNYKEARVLLGKLYCDTGEVQFVPVYYEMTYEPETHKITYKRSATTTGTQTSQRGTAGGGITQQGGTWQVDVPYLFYDAAIEQYRRAIEVDPNYAEAHEGLGITYAKASQQDRRVLYTDYRQHRDSYDGRVREKMTIPEMFEKAAYHLKKAVEFDPKNPYYRINLGVVYGELGLYEKAKKELKTALLLDNRITAAEANLAIIHSYQGAEAVAKLGYRKISKVEPKRVRAQEALKLLYPKTTPATQVYPFKEGVPLTPPGSVYPGGIPTPPGVGTP